MIPILTLIYIALHNIFYEVIPKYIDM